MKRLIEKLKTLRLYFVIKRFCCNHEYKVIGLDNFEQSKDEQYYLEGSEWWRGSKGVIYRKKLCSKCGKEGIHTNSFFT